MKSLLHHVFVLLTLTVVAHPVDLTSSGDWSESITSADLVAGAGSDVRSQLESVSGVTTLTISTAPGTWSLRVRLSGNGGSGDVTVQVKRTSGGSGGGSISGGTAYQALTGSDAELFSGSGDRSNISIQYKLTGLSRSIAPATYLSSIVFTVQ